MTSPRLSRHSDARKVVVFVSLCMALIGSRSAAAQNGQASESSSGSLPRLQAVRAAGRITLDGSLDEPAWAGAPLAHNFIQNEPREGQPATFDTEVKVLYDDNALYFG